MANHTPPRLFLIDGYALIYRAFYAMIARPLRTSKGENTSAAWGVVNFLMRLREKYRPDYVAWVNDAGTSFREERYPDYKSTREKLDDELQADVVEALRASDVPSGDRIRVAAAGSTVIVSGEVESMEVLDEILGIVGDVRGVDEVVDQLTVPGV